MNDFGDQSGASEERCRNCGLLLAEDPATHSDGVIDCPPGFGSSAEMEPAQ